MNNGLGGSHFDIAEDQTSIFSDSGGGGGSGGVGGGGETKAKKWPDEVPF